MRPDCKEKLTTIFQQRIHGSAALSTSYPQPGRPLSWVPDRWDRELQKASSQGARPERTVGYLGRLNPRNSLGDMELQNYRILGRLIERRIRSVLFAAHVRTIEFWRVHAPAPVCSHMFKHISPGGVRPSAHPQVTARAAPEVLARAAFDITAVRPRGYCLARPRYHCCATSRLLPRAAPEVPLSNPVGPRFSFAYGGSVAAGWRVLEGGSSAGVECGSFHVTVFQFT